MGIRTEWVDAMTFGQDPALPVLLSFLPSTNSVGVPLASTVSGLGFNTDGSPKFRLGLMLFTETGTGDSNVDGGYVRAAIRDLTATNKTKFVDLVNSLDVGNDKSNGGKAKFKTVEGEELTVASKGNVLTVWDSKGNTSRITIQNVSTR